MEVKVIAEGFAKKVFVCINDARYNGDGSYCVKMVEVSDTDEFREMGFTDEQELRSIEFMEAGDVKEFELGVQLIRVA